MLGDAVISLESKEINIITGSKKILKKNLVPFNKVSLDFLTKLSQTILEQKKYYKYNDLISFAFWCRKGNLKKKHYNFFNHKSHITKGLGILLHVPPSNTPVAAAYSFAFGLLSGNMNIIRISDPNLENIKILLGIIHKLLKVKKFKKIKENNTFISYERETNVSNNLSNLVDGRVIWGGEKTIKDFKKMDTKNSCRDIFFDDKYSISIIDFKKYCLLSEEKKNNLIKNFYNDTFVMDQNACSSPHLIFWLNKNLRKNDFWERLDNFVEKKYELTKDLQNIKYDRLNKILFKFDFLKESKNLKRISIYKVNNLNSEIINLRGYAGIFFETEIKNLNILEKVINEKFQTVTYFGINRLTLENLAEKNDVTGLCRIVPIGQAIDMDLIWDGKNVLNELTRLIEVR